MENSSNSAQLSCQALCHVATSTSVDIHCKFKQRGDEEECEEDLPLQTEEELCDPLPVFSSRSASPDSMESVGFFTSACSSPSALCSEPPSAQQSILLKQNSSSMPKEEKSHFTYEDKTPTDMISGCPDLTFTLEGATEVLSINSLSRKSGVKDKILPSVVSGVSHSAEGYTIEATHAERRLLSTLNLHPNCYSNEDNQSVCSIPETPVESHNFLSPNHEKFTYHKTVEDAVSIKSKNLTENEKWIISPTKPKTEYVHLQDSEASGISSFLELKPLRVGNILEVVHSTDKNP
ncbi:uncharacterized protein LOC127179649 [Labeo rohita]|uniref:uncharacterized protein LOC127179649 n=1 Tax=Labeo rohita TaxID=84645 RepID=UPI0021E32941|nr:uncharacterized protein LOC127179649 [Labeo rohita]